MMETWQKVCIFIFVWALVQWAIFAWLIAKAPTAEELWPNSPELW